MQMKEHNGLASSSSSKVDSGRLQTLDLGANLSAPISVHLAAAAKSPVMLFLPAMGVRIGFYKKFCVLMAQAGVHMVAAELRSTTCVVENQPSGKNNYGYKEYVEEDLPIIEHFVRERFPDSHLILSGHSLGGQLACLYAPRALQPPSGVCVIAGGNLGYQGWSGLGKIKILLSTQSFALISHLWGYFPGERIGFGGRQAKNIILDWARTARTGNYKLMNSDFDYDAAMGGIGSPILGLGIEHDSFAPPGSTANLVKKFRQSQQTLLTIPSVSFSSPRFANHFNWTKEPEPIVRALRGWIEEALTMSGNPSGAIEAC